MELPIYLIGYMGAGKTTAGRILADKLGWHFVDLDDAFYQIHGYTTADYIREFGLEEFRKKEKYVVEDLAELPYEHVIYATGGGYPCWEDNMDCLLELGTSIYLRWSAEHLARRLSLTDLSTRPVLQGRTQEELLRFIAPQLAERDPIYSRANHVLDVQQCDEESDQRIAEEIYQWIKNNH
ncbi:MAG: shikimate kinase [Paludibacteraceae bacterium]|jgi:shikimate kinase|nr:shikimate kinase [Paludibacteraceae bacterium]MBR6116849.1 shikimate kinase [Paludibacteraceae bacterium]